MGVRRRRRQPSAPAEILNSPSGLRTPAGQATRLIAQGRSLTEVAHEAGFADSAHLTKTFQATLGLKPSQLVNPRHTRVRHLESEPAR